MKTCPNPKCKTTGIPDEAKFCPNCGTALKKEEPVKKMTISECRLVPNVIKKGEKCELRWRGTNVKSIIVDGAGYSTRQDIFLAPAQSREYDIQFIGEDRYKNIIHDQIAVTVKSPFLFDGRGAESEYKGYFKVDIRQCKRTSGLGWDGKYEFSPGLPVGFSKFYALFDASQTIQVLIENGEISCIFFISDGYTYKIWKGIKQEEYSVWEGGKLFGNYVTKYRDKKVVFYGLYDNNDELLYHSVANCDKAKSCLDLLDLMDSTFSKEVYDFFGVSWEQLYENEDVVDYESYISKRN